MSTDIAPAPDSTSSLSLAQRIANFRGQSYLALLALLKNPGLPTTDMARTAGVTDDSIYRWRVEMPGFRDTMDTIRAHAGDLRLEYAQAAMREAIPDLADAMIQRGKGQGVAAQRAGERILEAQGVLPKDAPVSTGPIVLNVVYYTKDAEGKRSITGGVTVEGQVKELPPGVVELNTLKSKDG